MKIMRVSLLTLCIIGAGAASEAVLTLIHGQAVQSSVSPSAFMAASDDSLSGKEVYEQHCMACHAVDGHGLKGKYPDITRKYSSQKDPYERAFAFISRNMPQNDPGSLRDDEYKAVVKYVLSLNGVPTELSDVKGHWAQKEIADLFDRRYVDGYAVKGELQFKPDQAITRAEFVRFLVKTKELALSNQADSSFTDSAKFKSDKVYITTAVEYGLIDGFEDGSFRPDEKITRAEIAAILSRSEILQTAPTSEFRDVSTSSWFNAYVGAVTEAKLFYGYPNGTFGPEKPITRGESAVVLYRLIHPAE